MGRATYVLVLLIGCILSAVLLSSAVEEAFLKVGRDFTYEGAYSLSYDFRFLGCVTTSLNGPAMGTSATIFAMGRKDFLAILASIASASHWLDSFLF